MCCWVFCLANSIYTRFLSSKHGSTLHLIGQFIYVTHMHATAYTWCLHWYSYTVIYKREWYKSSSWSWYNGDHFHDCTMISKSRIDHAILTGFSFVLVHKKTNQVLHMSIMYDAFLQWVFKLHQAGCYPKYYHHWFEINLSKLNFDFDFDLFFI